MTNIVMPIQLRLGAFDAWRKRKTKWTKLLAMALLFVGPGCFGQTPPKPETDEPITSDPGFSQLPSFPPADPVPGPPVNLTMQVQNISDKEILWSPDRPIHRIGDFAHC